MNEYIKLRELISSLSDVEVKFLKRHFKQFKPDDSDSNFLILFNSLLKDPNLEMSFICDKLYGFENKSAFKKLAQRLVDRILDLLISKDLLLNENIHSERNRELFQIKRRFLYYDILSVHGLSNLALNNLNQIIKSAEELEYYDYLLIALKTKLVRLSRRSDISKISEIYKDIEFYSRCNAGLNKANYLLAHYTSMKNSGDAISNHYSLDNEINILEAEFEHTRSNRIKSAIYYLKGIQYSNRKKLDKAKANFYGFYNHLNKISNKINKSNDVLNCLLNICEFEIQTFEFKKAMAFFDEIDRLKVVNKFNLNIINEMKFLCFLSIGEVDIAIKYLKKVERNNDEFAYSVLQNDRLTYFNGVVAFVNRDFQNCSNLLNTISKITKSNIEWNLCQRLLLIMSFIESEKLSLADSHIETLRKFLINKKEKSVHDESFKMILKILMQLSKYGYDFKRAFLSVEESLELVDSLAEKKYFDHRSPYLIPFTPWFKSKLKNVPYDHSAAMKEMRRKYKAEKAEML